MNILVIDDEEEICRVITSFLSYKGHEVESVVNGEEGKRLAKDKYFDIVFLDIIMPGTSGMDVLKKIKKHSPKTKVIIMTGKLVEDNFLAEIKKKGASGCIQKPFVMEELLETILVV